MKHHKLMIEAITVVQKINVTTDLGAKIEVGFSGIQFYVFSTKDVWDESFKVIDNLSIWYSSETFKEDFKKAIELIKTKTEQEK